MKFQFFFPLLLIALSCSETQSAFESSVPTDRYKTKSFYAKNIVQRRTSPSLGATSDTIIVANRIVKDELGNDFYQVYTRPFFEFNFNDEYIDKSNSMIDNKITKNIELIIRVDKSTGINDLENFGLNQNLKLKLINESFKGDTVFRNHSVYWSAYRNTEAIANNSTVHDLSEVSVQSGVSDKQEFSFSFDKDLYTQLFLNLDTVASIKALMLDGSNLSGSLRLDTLPYLKITYVNDSDSTIVDKLFPSITSIWNSYTYLGNDINSDFSIKSGGREALVIEFDRDEVVNFLGNVIPFGANFSFKVHSLTDQVPSIELRQVTSYANTVVDLYNDGLDYGQTFTAGFYDITKKSNEDRLINEPDKSASLISNMITSWDTDNKLNGKVLLERTSNRRPGIIKFPKPSLTDTIYRLNIFYIEREVN